MISRRELVQAALTVPLVRIAAPIPAAAAQAPATGSWPRTAYRRFLVDTHIPDWHPDQLAKFDAASFVSAMQRGGAQALMIYANSHVGLALWPTKLGRMHGNLAGRDLFGSVVAECRRRSIHPLAYFSVTYDNWAFENHPDWRVLAPEGPDYYLGGRAGITCPNTGYRDYAIGCTREIVGRYELAGIFFDMTFWNTVCYCAACTTRFRREHGSEPPRRVDWDNPDWRAFQAARQSWLLEFARALTEAAHTARPGITVEHQFATIFGNWQRGQPLEIASQCDYVGGDFYGGPLEHSLVCKAYDGLTRGRPIEFMTSRTRRGNDHVTQKPLEEMLTEAHVATLHSAALLLIDYINIDGSVNPEVYSLLGKVAAETSRYEPYLGGDLLADVAVYFDKESLYNPAESGVDVAHLRAPDQCPHRDAMVGAARLLQESHIPYGVVTNANLERLERYRAVILPNVLELTEAQAERLRAFVRRGGTLVATGSSSLDRRARKFLLEDVLGVRYVGRIGTRLTYLTPRDSGLAQAVWPQDHVAYPGEMIQAAATEGAELLATVTLPFAPPEQGRVIGSRFGAYWSNPPALTPGSDPAVVLHRFDAGRALWLAAPLETIPEAVNRKLLAHLLRRVLPAQPWFELEAHPSVEMTLFHQPELGRLRAGLLNLQRSWPQVPVGARVRVRIPEGRRARAVRRLPDQTKVSFRAAAPYVEFTVEPFDALALFLVEYA